MCRKKTSKDIFQRMTKLVDQRMINPSAYCFLWSSLRHIHTKLLTPRLYKSLYMHMVAKSILKLLITLKLQV